MDVEVLERETAAGPDAAALTRKLNALPLTRLHVFILVACAVGFSFDLAEIAFGSILSAIFSAPPHQLDATQLSWLLSSVYVGAIAGAPLLGWLADKYGRRSIMLVALIILAVTSIGAAFSPNAAALTVFRGLSGFALGAYPPLMIAFMTDVFPAARRGRLVLFAVAIGYLGPPALIFLVRALIPLAPLGLEGWRWGFVVGGAGAALCAALFWFVPESARWLLSKGRLAEAEKAIAAFTSSPAVSRATERPAPTTATPPAAEMTQRDFVRRLAFLIGAYFLTPWATVGFTVLAGAVLVQKGINTQDSIAYVGVSTFGPLIGTILGGFVVDRLERRAALIGLAALMGIVGIAFGIVTDPTSLMGTGLVFNLLVNLFTPVVVLYAAELFSTDRRAQGTSWGWASNRVGSALVPLALLPLLLSQGPLVMFVVIAGTLIGFIAIVALFGPRGETGRAVS